MPGRKSRLCDKGDAPVHHPPEQRDCLTLIPRRAPDPWPVMRIAPKVHPEKKRWTSFETP